MNRIKLFSFAVILTFLACSCKQEVFVKNTGNIFGTSYHFTYKTDKGNLKNNILKKLDEFSMSLNVYDSLSLISRINRNETNIVENYFFTTCFNKAQQISEITNGAFDITVAPIVNAWGFGFKNATKVDSTLIDSLMQFVGYKKISIKNNKIYKQHPQTLLDISAIAKGYGVDIATEYLEQQGIKNYMVEIGGEVRVKGTNPKGNIWRIGIDKPIDNPSPTNRELQTIVNLKNKSLATSGNYRQFYKINGVKYAHTINPKTGYPALNKLLSTTVLANNCITADAFATAFMVMGVDKSILLAKDIKDIEIYLIYEDSTKQLKTYASKGFKQYLAQ